MRIFIVVKSSSQRYCIYDCVGNCVADVNSKSAVYEYINAVITSSDDYTRYFRRFTAVHNTFIVVLE